MDSNPAQKTERVAALVATETAAIAAAQRLAALDPDIRIAMSEVWWAALRVGLQLDREPPLVLPGDPFGAAAMERAGYRPGDF